MSLINHTISHYKILETIGEGGMGVVYKAHDLKLNRPVAIKFLSPLLTRDPDSRERFSQEARAVSALDHLNICTIYEIDQTDDGQIFMVIAYYRGRTLEQRIKSRALSIKYILSICIQIAEGLTIAHKNGIVHRDIKPGNIMITDDGIVKILDFGLAKLTGQSGLTREQNSFGTVNYMSPEQAQGKTVDDRTDIWSLGVLLYEMLCGRFPFRAEYEQAVIYNILNQDPEPIQNIRRGIPEGLVTILSRALAKNTSERYQTILEMLEDLKKVQVNIETGTRFKIAGFSRPKLKSGLIKIAGSVLVALGIVYAGYLWLNSSFSESGKSITILPFENLNHQEQDEYFSDGITEDIIVNLSKISGLRVISYRRSLSYKDTNKSLEDIGDELDVNHVLTGKVRRENNMVRITAQLYRTRSGEQVWAESYDKDFNEIFKIQREVAKQIAGALQIKLSVDEEGRIDHVYTKDFSAYDYYLRGRNLYHRLRADDNQTAIILFKKSIKTDPGFALGYSGLADAYVQKTLRFAEEGFWLDSAVVRCEKALAIDQNLAEAHKALGLIYYTHAWFDKALAANKKALEQNPNYYSAMHNLGWIYLNLGKPDLARYWLEKARTLDPLFSSTQLGLGLLELIEGNFPEAQSWLNRSYEVQPDLKPNPKLALILIDLINKNFAEARLQAEELISHSANDASAFVAAGDVALMSGDPGLAGKYYQQSLTLSAESWHPFTGINVTTDLGFIFSKTGHAAEAEEMLNFSENLDEKTLAQGSQWWGVVYDKAAIQAIKGNTTACFVWLDKAAERGFLFYRWLEIDPLFENIRDDRQFTAYLSKLKSNLLVLHENTLEGW